MSSKSKNVYIFFTLFYAYFILALFECARGNFIPYFINEFSINNTAVSFIISISQIGCIIGCFTAGSAAQRYGQKFTFLIGTLLCSLVAFSAIFINNVVLLCIFYLIFNIGRSFLCISVDSIVPMIAMGTDVFFINFTHFMYGIGSFTGQKIFGNLLFSNVSWKTIYFYLGFVLLLSFIFVLFVRIPKNNYVDKKISFDKKEFYKNPLLILFIFCLSLSCAGEGMMTTWYINYMNSSYSFNAIETARYSSVFFIAFSFGRLFGGMILQNIGKIRGLKIFMTMAAVFVIFGMILKQNGLMIIAIAGFFFSVCYPTLMVIISSAFKDCSSYAIGIITTWNAIFYILFTMLIGFLNDAIGAYDTFYLAGLFMIASTAFLITIDRKLKATNK